MRKNLAVCMFLTSVLISTQAHAFVDDESTVAEQRSLKPPASAALRSPLLRDAQDSDSLSFLGKKVLPQPTNLVAGTLPVVTQVINYFRETTGAGAALELRLLDVPQPGTDVRLTFVQTVGGVPVAGTFALAQVQGGALHYAQAYLVTPPRLPLQPAVSAEAATDVALTDARSFAKAATITARAELVVLYVDQTPYLVWQFDVSTETPFATWNIFVDAHEGTAVSRHKTSLNAVGGTVYGEYEPACQGDKPQKVAIPHIKWSTTEFTDADGNFSSKDSASQAQVSLHGKYFKIMSLGGGPKSWTVPLEPSPAHNDVTLENANVKLLDPYVHANTVRTWARSRLALAAGEGIDKAMAWTKKTVPVIVNFDVMKCNAMYMPLLGGILAFFSGTDGTCNNASQIAKVVYHEYGHGLHHHLSGLPAFNPQISEGAGDYVAATITNDPAMTGLLACSDTLPTGNHAVMRTCANHYSFCKDKAKCETASETEPHIAAPIICGAWWDLRESLAKRYGAEKGVAKADALFLKFLTLSTTMDKAYTAAIAADDDTDGDPSNGTVHSCEINRAFIDGEKGLQAHFPDSAGQKVPCKG